MVPRVLNSKLKGHNDPDGELMSTSHGDVGLEQQVTEQRVALERARADLDRNHARLDDANRELESLSYSVSHDLRAPLRHLHGFAIALQAQCGESLDLKAREYLSLILESTDTMNRLLEDLLRFARTGQKPLHKIEIDTSSLVGEVTRELKPEEANRQVEWQIGPLPRVRVDPAMLRQVWMNLLGNALKYTRQQPHPRIQLACHTNNGEWVFSVSDNGVGFDMAYSRRLFGLFQRLHHADEFEGTGLGLAIVRRIIDRHGGRTWAEGQPARGATFYFTLPRR
jgi:chemotaxis family two-component system sensor kinase Cph1